MYAINDRKSFELLGSCIKFLEETLIPSYLPILYGYYPMILIGNKLDLEDEREVEFEEGNQFAVEHKMPFIEVSSKSGLNIDKSIQLLLKEFERTYFPKSKNNIKPCLLM